MAREIPDRDEAFLRTFTGVQLPEPLPDKVIEEYWTYKSILNRTQSGQVSIEILALLVRMSGWTKRLPVDQKLEFAPELYQAGKLKVDDAITVLWRKKQTAARFKGITAEHKVRVEISGNEYVVEAEAVTLPKAAA